MSEIEPATDAEVAEWCQEINGFGRRCLSASEKQNSRRIEALEARIKADAAELERLTEVWNRTTQVANDQSAELERLRGALAELVALKRIKNRSLGRRWPGLDADYQHRKAAAWAAAFDLIPE